jgi:hypothetical protein
MHMDTIVKLALLFLGPSWRTSLVCYIGSGLLEASVALTQPAVDPKWHVLALVLAAFGRLAKDAAASGTKPGSELSISDGGASGPGVQLPAGKPDPTGASGFGALRLLLGLALLGAAVVLAVPKLARADDTIVTTPPGPLTTYLTPNLSLHLGVNATAVGYDLTAKTAVGQVAFGPMAIFDYKDKVGVGAGLSFLTGPTPGMTVDGALVGPGLTLGTGAQIRPAALCRYQWAGAVHDVILAGTALIQF